MTSFRQLSRPLRIAIAAPWLLLAALATSASVPAFRQLLLDSAGKPTADVSLASSHWTGTLDVARLPASVPLLDGGGNLTLPGGQSELTADGDLYLPNSALGNDGSAAFAASEIIFDAYGNIYANTFSVGATWGINYNGIGTFSQIYSDGNQISSDGCGNLITNTSSTNAAYLNLGLYLNGLDLFSDGSTVYVDGSTDVAGNMAVDNGYLSLAGMSLASDGYNLYLGGNLFVSDNLSANGNIHAGTLCLDGGFSLWGNNNPPTEQPPTPATLQDVINLLQAYGLCD